MTRKPRPASQMARPIPRSKKVQLYLITACVSLSIILLSGEILVRLLLPFNNPDTIRQYSVQYIPSLFSRHRLKPMGHMVDTSVALGKKSERDERYFINDVGYRGHNFLPRKGHGQIRIVIVGGSTVFDGYRKDESADQSGDWPHLVERFLRRRGHNNVEVINAGIPGHASFDALGRLYSQLWMYQPDYVIFYGAWNDIKYFRQLTPETPLISLFQPHEQQSNPFTEYQGLWDRFLSNSQLYVKIRNQYYGWKIRVGEEGAIPEGKYEEVYSAYAVRQYQLDVELIVDACRNIKAIPILLTEATLVSPNNSAEQRGRIAYHYQLLTHPALVRAFEDTYDVIRSVAKEKAVPILDLAQHLNGNAELFSDAVHLSSKGSQEVARRVGEFMITHLEKIHRASLPDSTAPSGDGL
jgi:lysophospholipase L1-like esterase